MIVPNRFKDVVVVVTGAGSGIGRGIASRFAAEGARVVLVDIREEAANAVLGEVQSRGGTGLVLQADATSPDDVKRAVETVISRFGRIDVLVNNVGLFVLKPIMEMSDADWEPMMDINAKSTFLWSKAAAKSMKEAKHGCIVNISSGSGKVGDPYSGVYVAAKHAVLGLTKNLALELAPYDVRVNAVCPVDTDTPMQKKFLEQLGARVGKSPDELRQETTRNIPLGRLATPEDIAGTVAFLASDDASFITGQAININGGWLML